MNHEPVEGSGGGGGCSYNDDEDCYSDDDTYYENYYYEGSGSGCGDGNSDDECKYPENSGGRSTNSPDLNKNHKKEDEEEEEEEENWPPWVTAKPETENKIPNDIEMVDEPINQVIKPKPRKPSFNRSGPNLTGSVRIITCATLLALYFAVKQVMLC